MWEAVRPLLEVCEKVRREIAALYRKLMTLARNDVDSRRSMTASRPRGLESVILDQQSGEVAF